MVYIISLVNYFHEQKKTHAGGIFMPEGPTVLKLCQPIGFSTQKFERNER